MNSAGHADYDPIICYFFSKIVALLCNCDFGNTYIQGIQAYPEESVYVITCITLLCDSDKSVNLRFFRAVRFVPKRTLSSCHQVFGKSKRNVKKIRLIIIIIITIFIRRTDPITKKKQFKARNYKQQRKQQCTYTKLHI